MKILVFLIYIIPLIRGDSNETSQATLEETTTVTTIGTPTITELSPTKCIADYLKTKGFLGNKNKTEIAEFNPECEEIVKNGTAEAVEKYRKRFQENPEIASKTDCLLEKLQKTDTFDRELITRLDLSAAKADESVLANSESLGLLKNVINVIKAIGSCELDAKFDQTFKQGVSESFDEKFKVDRVIVQRTDITDYCMRKYLIEHDLISFNKVNLNHNPHNIEADAINCTPLYERYFNELENELSNRYKPDKKKEEVEKWKTCFLRISKQHKFVDRMLQFDYVTHYRLTDELKENLRTVYIDLITVISKTAERCLTPEGFTAL